MDSIERIDPNEKIFSKDLIRPDFSIHRLWDILVMRARTAKCRDAQLESFAVLNAFRQRDEKTCAEILCALAERDLGTIDRLQEMDDGSGDDDDDYEDEYGECVDDDDE